MAAEPEVAAKRVQRWIAAVVGAKAAYIAPDSPWRNGCVGGFKAWLRGRASRAVLTDLAHQPDRGA